MSRRNLIGEAARLQSNDQPFGACSLWVKVSNVRLFRSDNTDNVQITPGDPTSMSDVVHIAIDRGLLLEEGWIVVEDIPRYVSMTSQDLSFEGPDLLVTTTPCLMAIWISLRIRARHAAQVSLPTMPTLLTYRISKLRLCFCPETCTPLRCL